MKFETIIDIDEKVKEEVLKVARDIAQKDATFIIDNVDDTSLTILSENRKKAKARGNWFYKKVSPRIGKKLYYNVYLRSDESK